MAAWLPTMCHSLPLAPSSAAAAPAPFPSPPAANPCYLTPPPPLPASPSPSPCLLPPPWAGMPYFLAHCLSRPPASSPSAPLLPPSASLPPSPPAGMPYFLTQKISWNNINTFPHTTFQWAGLDGSRLLTHFPPANTYNAQADAHDILASAMGSKVHCAACMPCIALHAGRMPCTTLSPTPVPQLPATQLLLLNQPTPCVAAQAPFGRLSPPPPGTSLAHPIAP